MKYDEEERPSTGKKHNQKKGKTSAKLRRIQLRDTKNPDIVYRWPNFKKPLKEHEL